MVVALVVLILTFGSFLAAGMPLITALLGVGISMALIFVMWLSPCCRWTDSRKRPARPEGAAAP